MLTKRTAYFLYLFCFVVIFCAAQLVEAGTKGKIAGIVIDAQTNEPLVGANIIITDTFLGATTDQEGNYFIINIPPGKYQVESLYIGYRTVVISDVQVSIDQTSHINFQMQEEMLESETIEVMAERPIVQKDLTSTVAKISGDQIAALPIEDLSAVVNLQAGVVDGHFRGGRSNEVKYLIDGISVNDAFTGDYTLEVDVNSIEEVQVLSGTFNAEYGEALSGVVNQVTKVPGNDHSVNISAYTGDYITNRTDLYKNIDHVTPSDLYNLIGSVSGPVPGADGYLKYYISGRYDNDQGYLYGQRMFNPWDYSDFSANDPEDWYIGATGDNKYVSMNFSRKTNLQGKIYLKVGEAKWITFQALYQNKEYKDYDHNYQLNPEGDYSRFQSGLLGSINYTHVFSPATFMDFKVSNFITEVKRYVYEDPLDPGYVTLDAGSLTSGNAFYVAGTENWHFYHKTKTYTGKIDLTSQITNIHQIKAGVEVQYHDLKYEDFQIHVDPVYDNQGNFIGFSHSLATPGSFDYNVYNNNPYQLAAYFQDKIELDYLIVNFGVRFDYFEPDGMAFKDPNNIAVLDNMTLPFPDTLFTKASPKSQLSPRIGLSYPISEKGAIHISYGHFFQVAPFEYLYRNPNFRIPLTGDFPEFIGNTIGNADLEPQRTNMYEIGLQQELFRDIGINVTAYYKDIRNLLGQELHIKNNFKKFGKYINRDYGSVKGFILSFEKRMSSGFAANIDYTYQIAKGNASDPNAAFEDAQANPPIETNKQQVPLDWDRLHSLNFTLTVGVPGDLIASTIGKLGSGLPYTPSLQDQRTGLENSDNRPTYFNLDLFVTKYFRLFENNFSIFMKIYNLLDTANENDVFTDTGRAGYSLELTQQQSQPRGVNTIEEYFRRPDYYSAPRQIIFGLSYAF
jgi:outer membrane receptor protein involved in Fe transport